MLVSKHSPLQHCHLKGHRIPHTPQLFTSELTFTHRFLQQFFLSLLHLSPLHDDDSRLHIHGRFQHPLALGSSSLATFFSHGDACSPVHLLPSLPIDATKSLLVLELIVGFGSASNTRTSRGVFSRSSSIFGFGLWFEVGKEGTIRGSDMCGGINKVLRWKEMRKG